jgi:hypothetical protein
MHIIQQCLETNRYDVLGYANSREPGSRLHSDLVPLPYLAISEPFIIGQGALRALLPPLVWHTWLLRAVVASLSPPRLRTTLIPRYIPAS